MDTNLVLDLFKRTTDEEDTAAGKKAAVNAKSNGTVSQKNILNALEELHDDDEYAEMNLQSFMSSIGR
jgi:TATA-binding protein-associated factor